MIFEDEQNDVEVWYSIYHIDRLVNPPSEYIKIRGGINADELVVDTWCVPEPATIGLLCLGTAMLRKRK
jgi:hypothetical protein